jgi:DNA-binding transcriptional LysR family regulator
VKPRITCNNQVTIKQFTIAGCGLSFGVIPEMADELATRKLVRALPDWSYPALSVDACCYRGTRSPPRCGLRSMP